MAPLGVWLASLQSCKSRLTTNAKVRVPGTSNEPILLRQVLY